VRRAAAALLLVGVLGGCSGHKSANGSNTPRITVGAEGPLAPGLLTERQLRQLPALSTATVSSLQETTLFEDPDPRGPCGGKVPATSLHDAAGVSIKAETIRGGAELMARLSPGAAKSYLDARTADATPGCPEFETTTNQGVKQRVLLVRIVPLHTEVQHALAVVTALKIDNSVRAATQIEVRHDDILAKTIIFTNEPMDDVTVRGIASLMGRDLSVFDS
jgi:hypothetical protein